MDESSEQLVEYLCYELKNAFDTQTMPKLNFGAMDMINCKLFSIAFLTVSFRSTLDSVGMYSPNKYSVLNDHWFVALAVEYPQFSISVRFYQPWYLTFIFSCISPRYATMVHTENIYKFVRGMCVTDFDRSFFWLPYAHLCSQTRFSFIV